MSTRTKKKPSRRRSAPKKRQFRDAEDFRTALDAEISLAFDASYTETGVDDEIRGPVWDTDDSETEASVIDGLEDATREVHGLIKNLETQLKHAIKVRDLLLDTHNRQLIVNEWREGMVECPCGCGHVFRAEDHTL